MDIEVSVAQQPQREVSEGSREAAGAREAPRGCGARAQARFCEGFQWISLDFIFFSHGFRRFSTFFHAFWPLAHRVLHGFLLVSDGV